MSKACKLFDYTIDEGTKGFCIAELFISAYTLFGACELAYDVTAPYSKHYFEKMSGSYLWELISLCTFTVTLIIQGLLGFLLYPYGWKKRNVTVIYAWMICGLMNVVNLVHLWILPHVATGPEEGWRGESSKVPRMYDGCLMEVYARDTAPHVYLNECLLIISYIHLPFYKLLYLIYIPYGIWVLWEFKTWARSTGQAVHITMEDVKVVEQKMIDLVHHLEGYKKEKEEVENDDDDTTDEPDNPRHSFDHSSGGHRHHHHHHHHHRRDSESEYGRPRSSHSSHSQSPSQGGETELEDEENVKETPTYSEEQERPRQLRSSLELEKKKRFSSGKSEEVPFE